MMSVIDRLFCARILPKEILIKPSVIVTVFCLSFALHLSASIFSEGRTHPDSDYQILEFANFKVGNESNLTLPWEFFEQIRPALQPALAFVVHESVGNGEPFQTAFFLRLMSAVLGLASSWSLCFYAFRWLTERWAQYSLIMLTGFFWLLPVLNARFASETWAAAFLAISIVLVHRTCEMEGQRRIGWAIFSGLSLAILFYLRFPVAFAILGLGLWVLFIARPGIRVLSGMMFGVALGLTLNILIDYWFYEEWVITPINYLAANLIEGRAAGYGLDPWWYFIEKIFFLLVPPASLFLMLMVVVAWVRKPKHILTWVSVFFLVGHSLVGHKETRFLFPIIYPLLIIGIVGAQSLLCQPWANYQHLRNKKIVKYAVFYFCIVNTMALLFTTFAPANQEAVIHKWIYNNSLHHSSKLLTYHKNPYHDGRGMVSFFRSSKAQFLHINSADELNQTVNESDLPVYVFVPSVYAPMDLRTQCISLELEVSALPNWIRQLDFGLWFSDLRIWSIFRCG